MRPLADVIRPKSLKEVVGQKHLLGENKLLRRLCENKKVMNMIFYGPPGTGKTTVANIIAKEAGMRMFKLNATDASISDIKNIIKELDNVFSRGGVLLYLDEIQNFNKKQQQSLLKYIENGQITLISSTTENPYFTIFGAILSRSSIFEFKRLDDKDILQGLKRGIDLLEADIHKKINYDLKALEYISKVSNGDLRRALNNLELGIHSFKEDNINIDMKLAKECTQTSGFKYDKFGDNHYDTLSAFQKSIRGSDVDAAIHYLARLIKSGDILSICRRLLVIAAEDIGLAYPSAISIVNSCVDSAMRLGLPEARIPLSQAVILLASSPKSNSVINAIDKALADIDRGEIGEIPAHLKDAHYKGAHKLGRGIGYKFPHDYPNNYVKQSYLPEKIRDKVYYNPGNNKMENKFNEHMVKIKK